MEQTHYAFTDHYNEGESENIVEEGLKMANFDHPNVLGLIGVCVDAGPSPYLIMPFMGHGNLLSFLKKRRNEFEFDAATNSDEERVINGRAGPRTREGLYNPHNEIASMANL